MAKKIDQDNLPTGGQNLDIEKHFPGDSEAQALWREVYDPLQRIMRDMFRDGVPVPSDLVVPTDEGAPQWRGFMNDRNYQQWTLQYQYWCIESVIARIDNSDQNENLPYQVGFTGMSKKLKALGLDPESYPNTSAKMRAVIYERIRTRKDSIRSPIFHDLMLNQDHIGHYLWRYLFRGFDIRQFLRADMFTDGLPAEDSVIPDLDKIFRGLSETERYGLGKQRVGQDEFRKRLVGHWGGCAITGLKNAKLLRASHAKPWADCQTDDERLDVFNGFLLSAQFDSLFDSGLMTVEDSGAVRFSQELSEEDRRILGLGERYMLRIKLDPRHLPYLRWHRESVYRV